MKNVLSFVVLFVALISNAQPYYITSDYTSNVFVVNGIEGPAVDANGNVYAVQFNANGKIGITTPSQQTSLFVTLPTGSIGNGIRFDSNQNMFIADYAKHKILKVNMTNSVVTAFATNTLMNQPNDLAIGANNIMYASDPNWSNSTGNIWRINLNGTTTLLEANMGTTNGIEVGPTENVLYVNESVQRKIWKYTLSSSGAITNKQLFTSFTTFGLDGMRTDNAGNLYVCRYGKGTVAKFSPSGVLLTEIQLTGTKPTNIAFGGIDGKKCFVTMADRGLIETFDVPVAGREWVLAHPITTTVNEDFTETIFSMYPNPSNGIVIIDNASNEAITNVTIYNINGSKVFDEQYDLLNSKLNIETDLPNGFYLINIKTAKSESVLKLIIDNNAFK